LKDQSGTAPQMAALERAGLVRGSDTTAVIHGMMGALGASAPWPIRRYDLTDEGRKYFQVKVGTLGQRIEAVAYQRSDLGSLPEQSLAFGLLFKSPTLSSFPSLSMRTAYLEF
jgi:hypothetical protein